MIIATAGHVDHGKTSLIKALTGTDTDKLPEEKKRGLTIELGFAYYHHHDDTAIGFIDVPGHHRFIANMLTGIAAIDFALVVIAADDGPMPQTHEHLAALNLMGLTHAAIVITKTDSVSQEQLSAVKEQVDQLVATTNFSRSRYFYVSSLNGDGIDSLRQHLIQQTQSISTRSTEGSFRLAVDRRFVVDGIGLVITGTVHSGAAAIGDEVVISPKGQYARIRSIHQENRAVNHSRAGHRCAINLTGTDINIDTVTTGSWIVHPSAHHPRQRFDGKLHVLNSEQKPLQHWTPVHLHIGASHLTGRVAVLTQNKTILPGDEGDIQIVLEKSIIAMWNDKFIIRDQSATRIIGGGYIIDPNAPARNRGKSWRQNDRDSHCLSDPSEALIQLTTSHPEGYLATPFLNGRNINDNQQTKLLNTLDTKLEKIKSGHQLILLTKSRRQELNDECLELLASFHNDHVNLLGCSPDVLFQSLATKVMKPVFNNVVTTLRQQGLIKHRGQVLHLPDHNPSLTADDERFLTRFLALMPTHDLCPPVLYEMAKKMLMDPSDLLEKLDYLSSMGALIGIQQQRYFAPEKLKEIAQHTETLFKTDMNQGFTAADFKNATGIGRRPTIQILEFFDRAGLTLRQGNYRIPIRTASEIFGE
jgi:selenocysteine-specific elongation factor